MLKSAQIENPNIFFIEKVSPSTDVNNSDNKETNEMIKPILEINKIIMPLMIRV